MRILVSGFEAFGGESINPTHLLVDELRAGRIAVPAALEVKAVLLPVGFESAFDSLTKAILDFKPQIVLSLGQAGGRQSVELERVAVNIIDAEIPDNDGRQPRDEHINPTGLSAYFSTLPLRQMENALTLAQIPVRISNSAGLYVCNFLFYRLQEFCGSAASTVTASGFVHFPYLPEQAAKNSGTHSMSLETMKRALQILLEQLR